MITLVFLALGGLSPQNAIANDSNELESLRALVQQMSLKMEAVYWDKGKTYRRSLKTTDNVALNFTGAWGSRKNSQYGTTAPKTDIGGSIDNFTLYQFDVTYKF